MKILAAFDKYKGALTADQACGIVSGVLSEAAGSHEVSSRPITDGGEGFCEILTRAGLGKVEWLTVRGPRGTPVRAPVGWVEAAKIPAPARARLGASATERLAIVEMASASGLLLLDEAERDPWETATHGTGELLRHAANRGADRIVLGVGGSATNDLGAGCLEELGVRFYDREGGVVTSVCPRRFEAIALADFSGADFSLPVSIACDVTNPLLGANGATAVYGPQKGLASVEPMEAAVRGMAAVLAGSGDWEANAEQPSRGAAGGIVYGLSLLGGVSVVPGFAFVWDWMALGEAMNGADWLLTGEGKIDAGSLEGKGPLSIAREALEAGIKVALFPGAMDDDLGPVLRDRIGPVAVYRLSSPEWPLEVALKRTETRLREAVGDWLRENGGGSDA